VSKTSAFSELKAPWPGVASQTLTAEIDPVLKRPEFGLSMEPGATQLESANLVLPGLAEVVQIYSFLAGPTNPRGWWDRTVIDLRKEKEHGLSASRIIATNSEEDGRSAAVRTTETVAAGMERTVG
jgi:hypothetical protein